MQLSETISTRHGGGLAALRTAQPTFSVEAYTARCADEERALWPTLAELRGAGSQFTSVTYGAGGTGERKTLPTVARLAGEGVATVAHLTAVGASVAQLRAELVGFREAGCRAVLALRGDAPAGGAWRATPEGLRYARELVALAREVGGMSVGVAAFPHGHPESPDLQADRARLFEKLDAGADFAISQHFFDPAAFLRLRDAVATVCDAVVVPGLIPVTTPRLLRRAQGLAGVPLRGVWAERLRSLTGQPEAFRSAGLEYTQSVVQRLLREGVRHVHFYTLNRATATITVARGAGLAPVPPAGATSSE